MVHHQGGLLLLDDLLVDDDLLDVRPRGQLVHRVQQGRLDDGPRAAEFCFSAALAMAASDPLVKRSLMPSISNSFWYCFIRALRGLVRISTRASSDSSCSGAITGRRPMNSGIMPYLSRSSGCTS